MVWPGKGLYVVIDGWATEAGWNVYLLGIEGQADEKTQAWRVRPVVRPTADAVAAAIARRRR